MKRLSVLLLAIFIVTVHAETVDRVVAVVGSEVITLYDLDRAMAPYLNEIKKAKNKDSKFKEIRLEVLSRLVDDLLLRQAVAESKVVATDDDLARAIRNVLAQNHITIEILKDELARKGISFDSYRDQLRKDIQRIKFVNQEIGLRVKISDQDLRDYYERHMDEFGAHQSVHIAQIVLPFDETTTDTTLSELKAKADEISSQARSGSSFSELAKKHSKGANAENGGDLGIVDPSSLMPEITDVIQSMNVGEVSRPILSSAGIHIIKLIDRAMPKTSDFEKLKDRIYSKMYDKRVAEELRQYLSELRKKMYVEIRE